jgi:hypothetical protein
MRKVNSDVYQCVAILRYKWVYKKTKHKYTLFECVNDVIYFSNCVTPVEFPEPTFIIFLEWIAILEIRIGVKLFAIPGLGWL